MTPRFDRNRNFGTVLPSNHYYQDGHYFDAQENYLRSDVEVEPAPAAPEPPAPTPVPAATPAPAPQQQPAPAAPEATEIDLAAWARGEQVQVHFKVVRAMHATYPDAEFGKSRASIVQFLIDQGVVKENEAVL